MSEIVQPSDKIKLIFILLTTNLYDISHTDLYGTIYIDNIQKAVVICLIIPTTFPFDAGSMVDNVRHTSGYFLCWILAKYRVTRGCLIINLCSLIYFYAYSCAFAYDSNNFIC